MVAPLNPEKMRFMTSDVAPKEPVISGRLADLENRRSGMGVSVERLSQEAGYKSTQTWYDTVRGNRPAGTLEKFEMALDRLELEVDMEKQEQDDRATRGKALVAAMEKRRPQGLSINKLLKWAGLTSPVWQSVQKGTASVKSLDALEAGIRKFDESPADFDGLGSNSAQKAHITHSDGLVEVELRGFHGYDFAFEQILVRAAPTEHGAIRQAIEEAMEALRPKRDQGPAEK